MTALDEIKERIDIVDLIGQRVPLKKSGKTYRGSCPFHADRSPSFYVYPEDWSYHCFGCQAHGSGIDFVMTMEKLDFGEALRELANRAGITLPDRRVDAEEERERRHLLDLQAAAAQYFHHLLLNAGAAAGARAYLERRGISRATVDAFQLGYSLPAWDELGNYLLGRGFSTDDLIRGGLAVAREGDGHYDRFRNRVIFPIAGRDGEILGFGGRALDDADRPKYLNSPETPLFEKGSVLYGLDRARAAARAEDRAVVVEGYVDVLMAHQAGLKNVVGAMGTALSERQVRSLKRLTKRIVLALDADAGGEEALLRGLELAGDVFGEQVVPVPTWRGLIRYEHALDTDIRVATLPPGRDPDEVIREDPAAWRRLVEEAVPILDYLFRVVTMQLDPGDPKNKSAIAHRLLAAIRAVPDRIVQAHYVQRLAATLRVEEKTLWPLLSGERRPARRRGPETGGASKNGGEPAAESASPAGTGAAAGDALEAYCLAILIRFPDLGCAITTGVEAGDFVEPEHREIFRAIAAGRSGELREALDTSLHRRLDQLLNNDRLLRLTEDEAQCELVERLRTLRLRAMRRTIKRLGETIDIARQAGDPALAQELEQQHQQLLRQLQELEGQESARRAGHPRGGHPASRHGV